MKSYFTIGEISNLFGIGTDTIRYYEKIGALCPARNTNGYRIYSVKDIWRINTIRDLRALNFSMNSIREYLNNRNVLSTLELLKKQKTTIEAEQQRLTRRHDNIAGRISMIQRTAELNEGVIYQESFHDRRCYIIQERFMIDEEMDVFIQRLLRMNPQHLHIIGNNCIGARLCAKAVENEQYNEYDAVLIIDENGDTLLPGSEYLYLYYRGCYKKNSLYIPRLLEYAVQNNLQPAGNILELLLIDIHTSSDLTEYVTELQLPVKPLT